MTKPEFTPGPWEHLTETSLTGDYPFIKAHRIKIGQETLTIGSHTIDWDGSEEMEANAKLIAAAPDMYEILNLYEEWEADLILDSQAWQDNYPRFTKRLYDKWMEIQAKRNAVLAKARGENHV